MIDFAAARRMMVDGQVRTADVTDPRLLAAMLELPRERFFPEDKASLAYLDLDVPVSEPGQPVRRLLKPMVLAKLIQAAGDHRNRPRARCRLRHRLFDRAAGASRGFRGGARGGRGPGAAGGRCARLGRHGERQDCDRPVDAAAAPARAPTT